MRLTLIAALFPFLFLSCVAYKMCTSDADCSYRGTCNSSTGDCVCQYYHPFGPAFTTVPENSTLQCNYERKVQLYALLFQIFGSGLGAGYFYLGYTGYGAGQLTLTLSIPLLVAIFMYGSAILAREWLEGTKRTIQISFVLYILVTSVALSWFVIGVYQLVRFDPLVDSGGVELVRLWSSDRMN